MDNKLAEIRESFYSSLQSRLSDVKESYTQLQQSWDQQLLHEFYCQIHNLAGASGVFGAANVSFSARRLEIALTHIIEEFDANNNVIHSLDELVSHLRETIATERYLPEIPTPSPYTAEPIKGSSVGQIVVVDDDHMLAEKITIELSQHGFNVLTYLNLGSFRKAYKELKPLAIIMDIVFPEGEDAGVKILKEIKEYYSYSPLIIFMSMRSDVHSRLSAVRLGAARYFIKPLDFRQLTASLDGLTKRTAVKPYRILIIDDDKVTAEYSAEVLRSTGMMVETLNQPLEALEIIKTFKPELILMDIYMPECTGIELAEIIRQKDEEILIPIIYLSSEQDKDKQINAILKEGDDFILKPINSDHLIKIVSSHVKRARRVIRLNTRFKAILRENEYQRMAMDQHDIVSMTDANGLITYTNKKFCNISGYQTNELIGQNHRLINSGYHPKQFFDEMWSTIYSGNVWHGEICNRTKKGDLYWVESTIVPFLDENNLPYQYVSIRTDITSFKLNEKKLRLSEERLLRSQEFSNIGTWDWNIETDDLYWSAQTALLFGYEKGELTTTHQEFLSTVYPDDCQNIIEAVNNCIDNNTTYEIEYRYLWPDGSIHWMLERGDVVREESGIPIHMLGVVQDITVRKHAEQSLQRFRASLDSSEDSIYLIDRETMRFIDTNQSGWVTLGYSRGELLEIGPQNIIKDHTKNSLSEIFDEIIQRKFQSKVIETILISKDGFIHPVEMKLHSLVSDDQQIIIAVARDITQRKRAEKTEQIIKAELQSAKEQAEEANRAKSQFLSSMSHELRTPMNAILGFGQLMEITKTPPLSDEQQECVQEIIKAGKHLLTLINEVLDFAKIDTGRINLSIEPVEIDQLVNECKVLLAPLHEKCRVSLKLDKQYCHGLAVWADRTRLKQVLLNLLSNAIKYNHENGRVTINCANYEAGSVRIEIKDTGPGIPAQHKKNLFTAFNRLGAEQTEIEGTGIGLVITKNLVELMGGDIDMSSEEGHGSTFWVDLPEGKLVKVPHKTKTQNKKMALLELPTHREYTILYVEDNLANLRLIARLIGRYPNIKLITAHEAKLGIDLAQSKTPDLIILDINLPDMNGYDALEQLHKLDETTAIPVIAVSAHAMPENIQRGFDAGFTEYITKPIDVQKFCHIVNQLLTAN